MYRNESARYKFTTPDAQPPWKTIPYPLSRRHTSATGRGFLRKDTITCLIDNYNPALRLNNPDFVSRSVAEHSRAPPPGLIVLPYSDATVPRMRSTHQRYLGGAFRWHRPLQALHEPKLLGALSLKV